MPKHSTTLLQSSDYFERYYLKLKTQDSSTKITRSTKAAAKAAYQYYLHQGREVMWLGKWNGQSFEDTTIELEI